ncbi:nuclear transport factor 2 family protein [Mycobacterium sherrisii]|uniref:nuclear transport factor 2 family protein n=1 Tax=Mycobacterium sherrisii TaxID=243061 RepID=UPI0039751CDC
MSTIDEIGARLRRLEDEHDIAQLIASYGPAVDAANADAAAALWAADGSYDVEGWCMQNRVDVHAMVSSASHRNLVAKGCCHFLGPSVVTVSGDSAVAVCESLVLVSDGSGYRVWRATANHFELRRIDGQWRIAKRTSRVLDGQPGAHALLRTGLAGVTAPALDEAAT